MIQDIAPHEYHLDYSLKKAGDTDPVFVYRRQNVLVKEGEELKIPSKGELLQAGVLTEEDPVVYLFRIDETEFFCLERTLAEEPPAGFRLVSSQELRQSKPQYLSYAAITGNHLFSWYASNRFCGRCGSPMVHDEQERAQRCPSCGAIVYPRINPSCIIGILDPEKQRMLVTQYNPAHFSAPVNASDRKPSAPASARPSNHYALVAGYVEIGESGEMTVKREVMEEVGLKVKNIRYYASQPWAFSSSFLLGYLCDLDGSDQVKIEENELSVAVWKTREEMPDRSSDYSLTSAIMEAFRKGEI